MIDEVNMGKYCEKIRINKMQKKNLKKAKIFLDRWERLLYNTKAARKKRSFFSPVCQGSIAQLGEHLPYKQGVTGSSPVVPTIIRRCSSVG